MKKKMILHAIPFWYCIGIHSVLAFLKREKQKENNKKYYMESKERRKRRTISTSHIH